MMSKSSKNRKIFLSSAGLRPEFHDDFIEFLGKKPEDCSIAFIPTAADPEEDKSFVSWTTDQIEAAGFCWYEVDLKGENAESLKKKLAPADIIMVNGGNTFYLLDQARKSGFVDIIGNLLDGGKLYFGISAGSYLACPTIEAAKWKHLGDLDVVGSKDLSALGLVDFLIVAHYEEKYWMDVNKGAATTKLQVVTLTNNQAILIDGSHIGIVGGGGVLKLNNFEER